MNMDTNVIRNRESARKNIPDDFLHLDLCHFPRTCAAWWTTIGLSNECLCHLPRPCELTCIDP
jgi:hypothetical protein